MSGGWKIRREHILGSAKSTLFMRLFPAWISHRRGKSTTNLLVGLLALVSRSSNREP